MENEIENESVAHGVTEETADFARVAAMVAAGEPEAGAVVETDPEPQKADAAESLSGFLTLAGAMSGAAGFGRTAAIWNPETCEKVAGLTVPVLRKYPWGQRVIDFFETGAGVEEIALGVVVAPLALATYAAIKADMQPEGKPRETPEKTPTVSAGELREVHGHANQ